MSELNEEILDVVEDGNVEEVSEDDIRDSLVITVPIDSTLSISGAAADARAAGQAINAKASESDVKTLLSVNGRTGNRTWTIMTNGGNIPAQNDNDSESVAEALTRIDNYAHTQVASLDSGLDTLQNRLYITDEPRISTLEAKKLVLLRIAFTAAATETLTITGITADHELIGHQFIDSSNNPTGEILADLAWTTAAGSVTVVFSNVRAAGSVRLIFGVPDDVTPEEVES